MFLALLASSPEGARAILPQCSRDDKAAILLHIATTSKRTGAVEWTAAWLRDAPDDADALMVAAAAMLVPNLGEHEDTALHTTPSTLATAITYLERASRIFTARSDAALSSFQSCACWRCIAGHNICADASSFCGRTAALADA